MIAIALGDICLLRMSEGVNWYMQLKNKKMDGGYIFSAIHKNDFEYMVSQRVADKDVIYNLGKVSYQLTIEELENLYPESVI